MPHATPLATATTAATLDERINERAEIANERVARQTRFYGVAQHLSDIRAVLDMLPQPVVEDVEVTLDGQRLMAPVVVRKHSLPQYPVTLVYGGSAVLSAYSFTLPCGTTCFSNGAAEPLAILEYLLAIVLERELDDPVYAHPNRLNETMFVMAAQRLVDSDDRLRNRWLRDQDRICDEMLERAEVDDEGEWDDDDED